MPSRAAGALAVGSRRGGTVAVVLLWVALLAAERGAASNSWSCPSAWNATSTTAAQRALFFNGTVPDGSDAQADVPPLGVPCRARLCECWGRDLGLADAARGCDVAPARGACRTQSGCVEDFIRCQIDEAAGPVSAELHSALVSARIASRAQRPTSDAYRGCLFAACYLFDAGGVCAPHDAGRTCWRAFTEAFSRTATPTFADVPATPAPLAIVPLPNPMAADQFDFEATTERTTAGQAQLARVLSTFAESQVETVVSVDETPPRRATVDVRVEALNIPDQWVATVSVVSVGGTVGATELARLLAQRCVDAVADTDAKPPAFESAGIRGNMPREEAPRQFPNIADSSMEGDETLVPLWGLAVGILVAVIVGTVTGALLARTACRVGPPPSLRERLGLDGEDNPGHRPEENPYALAR